MDRFMECEAEFNGTFDEPFCCVVGANYTRKVKRPSSSASQWHLFPGEHP